MDRGLPFYASRTTNTLFMEEPDMEIWLGIQCVCVSRALVFSVLVDGRVNHIGRHLISGQIVFSNPDNLMYTNVLFMQYIYGTQAVAHPSHHINKYAIYSVKVLVYTSVQYSQPMADSCVATLLYMQTKGVDSPTNKTIQNERIKFRMPTNGIMCCRLRAQIPRAILAWE